jgi:hypothetical protein
MANPIEFTAPEPKEHSEKLKEILAASKTKVEAEAAKAQSNGKG